MKLPCEVEGTKETEVVALGRSFQDPLTATDSKVGVVELFWEVRKKAKPNQSAIWSSLSVRSAVGMV